MDYKELPGIIKVIIILFLMLMVLTILVVGREFLYPVFLAILISYLLYPLADLLERWKMPRVLAILTSIILGIILIGGGLFLLYRQMTIFFNDFPQLKTQALDNLDELQGKIDQLIGNGNAQNQWLRHRISDLLNNSGSLMNKVFDATTGTAVKMGLQPVFVFFMLFYRNRFEKFLFGIWGLTNRGKLVSMLQEISEVTKNYISGVFLVVLILCFINSIGLMIVGVDYAIMFGILSAIMNFIPYFGTLIGAAFPLAYTLVSDEPGNVIGVIILFLIIQFTENNILTPNITGGRVAINPLFTILIIIAGGMIWGLPGMFMSVPYTGMFKVVCNHYTELRPIAFLLSRDDDSYFETTLQRIKRWLSGSKEHP